MSQRGVQYHCAYWRVHHGDTIEEATANLREALELFFEAADPEEINRRVKSEVYVTQFEVAIA